MEDVKRANIVAFYNPFAPVSTKFVFAIII